MGARVAAGTGLSYRSDRVDSDSDQDLHREGTNMSSSPAATATISVVIAAHNEESTVGRTLDRLLEDALPGELEVVVVANGCTDRTAEIARQREVVVIDLERPGKAGALNVGDEVATVFPRFYLDADIEVSAEGLRILSDRLVEGRAAVPPVLAVVPARRLVTTGRPWPVRAHAAISSRLPAFRDALFGRGLIGLSDLGRARFEVFPEIVADDLFLDGQFGLAERREVDVVVTAVQTPLRTADLMTRLERVRRGNARLRQAAERGALQIPVRQARRWSWLTDVVRHDLHLLPAGIVYAVLTAAAAVRGRRRGGATAWSTARTRGEQ